MSGFAFVVLAAAGNNAGNWLVIKFLIFLAATFILTIVRKVAESREKANRANTAPKPPATPAPKKDNPFRNEIEAFLEEVGKRRTASEKPGRLGGERTTAGELVAAKAITLPRTEPARKPVPLRPAVALERQKADPAKAAAAPSGLPPRPGEEIASRRAPGSEDLGKQIRSHLAQYLDASRLAAQTQNDLGNAVERNVRAHLGPTITAGVSDKQPEATAEPNTEASAIVPLLRNRSSVRTAIVINEILGPPRGLRRRP